MGLISRIHAGIREKAKLGSHFAQIVTHEGPRSPHWSTIEKRWKIAHPTCAACGSFGNIQIHHVLSFATHPELELQDGTGVYPATGGAGAVPNLISLCEGSREHHIHVGHGGSFAKGGYNPNVLVDAAEILAHPENEAVVVARAKAARISPPEVQK